MLDTLYLRRVPAAEYIKKKFGVPCSPKTLAKLAVIGGGPAFRKSGRFPVYTEADLDNWASSRISSLMHSTSDAPVTNHE